MLNNEISILYLLTTSILSILVILLVYLTLRKAISIRQRKMIEIYKEKYNLLLFTALIESRYSRKLTPETMLQQKALEELLSSYTKILEGEDERESLSQLANHYLSGYYRNQLKSWRWSIRMNTLYQIEDFHMSHLVEDVNSLLNKRGLSHQELFHTLRILALFKFPHLLELLTARFDFLSEYEYRNILIRMEQKEFDQFLLHFHGSKQPLQKAVLDVISIKKETSYLSFLEKIFSSYSGEIKLRALKALAEIGFVSNIDPYLELLYSSKWEERMVAAKLVGSLKEEKGVSRLIELLHDSSWWVRSQAGQAISQFSNGKEILRHVLETSEDIFAKDMAWEWLHKGV